MARSRFDHERIAGRLYEKAREMQNHAKTQEEVEFFQELSNGLQIILWSIDTLKFQNEVLEERLLKMEGRLFAILSSQFLPPKTEKPQ